MYLIEFLCVSPNEKASESDECTNLSRQSNQLREGNRKKKLIECVCISAIAGGVLSHTLDMLIRWLRDALTRPTLVIPAEEFLSIGMFLFVLPVID